MTKCTNVSLVHTKLYVLVCQRAINSRTNHWFRLFQNTVMYNSIIIIVSPTCNFYFYLQFIRLYNITYPCTVSIQFSCCSINSGDQYSTIRFSLNPGKGKRVLEHRTLKYMYKHVNLYRYKVHHIHVHSHWKPAEHMNN